VSRQRLSKWVHRYRDGGDHALLNCSSAPRHRPTRTPQPTIDRIIDLRKRHRWPARTIASHLTDEGTPVSTATVTRHLKDNGTGCAISTRHRRTEPPTQTRQDHRRLQTFLFEQADGPRDHECDGDQ
jgi:hypothetical protein